jgi:hypothetical protein
MIMQWNLCLLEVQLNWNRSRCSGEQASLLFWHKQTIVQFDGVKWSTVFLYIVLQLSQSFPGFRPHAHNLISVLFVVCLLLCVPGWEEDKWITVWVISGGDSAGWWRTEMWLKPSVLLSVLSFNISQFLIFFCLYFDPDKLIFAQDDIQKLNQFCFIFIVIGLR